MTAEEYSRLSMELDALSSQQDALLQIHKDNCDIAAESRTLNVMDGIVRAREIIRKFHDANPPEQEDIKPTQERLYESMTRLHHHQWMIRVWRQAESAEQAQKDAEAMELVPLIISKIPNNMNMADIVDLIAEMDRVNAVEVMGPDMQCVLRYNDWP